MNKILKIGSMLLIFALFSFSCKHDQGGGQTSTTEEKALVLSSFKVGASSYNKDEKTISVTKQTLTTTDLEEVVFTDESGNAVSGVEFKIKGQDGKERIRIDSATNKGTFKIVVSTPPSGYKAYESDEITAIRELVSPRVTALFCHGIKAELTTNPFTVRIPKPTAKRPQIGHDGKKWGDISIQFDKEVPEMAITWEGLPEDEAHALKPEEVAHVTFRVPEKAGSYKAGEYKLDITFDTPSLSIASLSIQGQDGDTDLTDLKNLKVKVNVVNGKDKVEATDVTVTFKGDYIEASELSAIQATYDGLPLTNLLVSQPKTFTVKVAAKAKKYKEYTATVTVTRANEALKLKKISIFETVQGDITQTPFKHTVETMKTFVKKGDIKATFTKPDASELEVDCLLKGAENDKVYLKAGVKNLITFYVPATEAYAEYRNQVEITHDADWENMIELPMPTGGVTFKSGNKDETDKSFERKFAVAQFPVTWKLFKEVCEWAESPAGKAKGYNNFNVILGSAQNGAIESGKDPETGRRLYTSFPKDDLTIMRPACSISYHAAVAWCNAYSEMKGYAPAYYKPESGKIDVKWKKTDTGLDGNDWTRYSTFNPTITVDANLSADEISKLALRDALNVHHPKAYVGEVWNNIKDNYYKVAVLTAGQAKFADASKTGFRLVDVDEWEFASRLRLTKGEYCTTSTLSHNGITYFFANKDSAAGSEGYGNEGSEIEKVAWVSGNSAVNGKLQVHPIGEKIPTDLCFYDLAGNVGSWTNTWSKHNGSQGETPDDYTNYAVGGGFCDPASRCVVNGTVPSANGRYDQCGIRLCRTLE